MGHVVDVLVVEDEHFLGESERKEIELKKSNVQYFGVGWLSVRILVDLERNRSSFPSTLSSI